jgi:hypothetical protein
MRLRLVSGLLADSIQIHSLGASRIISSRVASASGSSCSASSRSSRGHGRRRREWFSLRRWSRQLGMESGHWRARVLIRGIRPLVNHSLVIYCRYELQKEAPLPDGFSGGRSDRRDQLLYHPDPSQAWTRRLGLTAIDLAYRSSHKCGCDSDHVHFVSHAARGDGRARA